MSITDRLTQQSDIEENTITIELPQIKHGNSASVTYNGTLSNSGADRVFLHYGYDGWHNTDTIAMKKDIKGNFSTEIKVRGHEEMNFCFKDSANNWDNNNGMNWKVNIDY